MYNNKFKRMIEIATKLRVKSKSDIKMVAIVFKHGKILATGVNNNKSHPLFKKYFIHASCHAEIVALISVLYYDYDNLSMFVCRTKGDGSMGNAKPCPMCVNSIYDNGKFNKIYWTNDNGEISMSSIGDLKRHVDTIDKNILLHGNGRRKKIAVEKVEEYRPQRRW